MHHDINSVIIDIEFVRSFKSSLAEKFDYADLFVIKIVSFKCLNQILCDHVYQILDHIFRVEEHGIAVN